MDDDNDGTLNLDAAMEEAAEGIDFDGPDDDGGSLETGAAPESSSVSRETTQTTTTTDELPMPQSWKKEWENDWKATPQTARQRFMEREKQMLDGLEQYKGDAGYGKALREVFSPYKDFLQAQGVDEPKAVQYLLNAHYRLTSGTIEDKRAYWSQLAKSYGLDTPAAANADGTQQQLPQEVQDALTRLARIEGNLSQRELAEKQQRTELTKKQVNEFADDPAHAYFDECAEHISKLITAGYGLQEAYDTAVYANPVTRAKELQRLQTEAAQALKEKAKQTATARRKATSVNVNPTSTSRTPTEGPAKLDDLDSVLRETAAEMRARAH